MTATTSRSLLLEIARCPEVVACLKPDAGTHPCRTVVEAQKERLPEPRSRHVPEPWSGSIATAPVLFVSSNPSFNPNEQFPTRAWDNEKIVRFFDRRFEHSDQSSHYWVTVRHIAESLLGRPSRPGTDYALTEVVRCKSLREEGVRQALPTCASRYLHRTLEASGASVVVALGKKARDALAAEFEVVSEIGLVRARRPNRSPRTLLMLGHPSSGQRKMPTSDEVAVIQSLLSG